MIIGLKGAKKKKKKGLGTTSSEIRSSPGRPGTRDLAAPGLGISTVPGDSPVEQSRTVQPRKLNRRDKGREDDHRKTDGLQLSSCKAIGTIEYGVRINHPGRRPFYGLQSVQICTFKYELLTVEQMDISLSSLFKFLLVLPVGRESLTVSPPPTHFPPGPGIPASEVLSVINYSSHASKIIESR
eukprot:747366-Hanusia_phi.AAC.1